MSTSIRVSDETKRKLTWLKRDGETRDEFLSRLADDAEPINVGAWAENDADRARDAVERSRERFRSQRSSTLHHAGRAILRNDGSPYWHKTEASR
ncbi:antitoxin VapB family protein [Halobacterium rubrum]|uniref:antitoxin VapB family protein n=1 Tax=Halobacterium TaxID=2239 RepID=UPI001F22A495|nr:MULTISPECIES: antitoxin VapB family protein [Halobacterium]MDH5020283.1 antitoxin VapB family protein [Halobacterium rubrum]